MSRLEKLRAWARKVQCIAPNPGTCPHCVRMYAELRKLEAEARV